ncbi:MAG: alpha/beta fold hydrolase [Myxococcota bacterium]
MGLLPAIEAFGRFYLRLRGVESRTLEWREGGPLHFFDARGRGPLPPLVLQHGIGAGKAIQFAPQLLRLRGAFRRVLAPDLPGHGYSAPATTMSPETVFAGFAEVLDRELTEPGILVGNSLGGAMVVQYALIRPEKVKGLVLVSPGGAPVDAQELERFLAGFHLPDDDATMRFLERLYHRVPFGTRWLAGDVRALFSAPPMRELFAAIRAHHLFTPEVVAALRAPTLLLWGRSDRVMLPAMREFFRAHLPPGTVIEEPEGVGHCPHFERPFWIGRRIRTFAESIA